MRKSEGKILGVIGGMGPLATQEFYKMLITKNPVNKDQEHINIIILNHSTIPDRTDMIKSGRSDKLSEILIEDAKLLESMGADVIAVPCNTSHVVLPELSQAINIPVINMVEEAARRIHERNENEKDSKVAILATDGTIATGLYQNALEKRGIPSYNLSDAGQRIIMSIIYDGIKAGGEIDLNLFAQVEREIKENGCSLALMACTELSCFKQIYMLPEFYLDAMEILAEESIARCK